MRRMNGGGDGGGDDTELTWRSGGGGTMCWRRQARWGRCGGSKESIREGKTCVRGRRRLVYDAVSRGRRSRCGGRREKGLQGHFASISGWGRRGERGEFGETLCKDDAVSSVAIVGARFPLLCCGGVLQEASTGDVALASCDPISQSEMLYAQRRPVQIIQITHPSTNEGRHRSGRGEI